MTTIHCAENILVSGGTVKLYESRDAFLKGGSSFERAQIVRLDARWISMLRYHLGTSFEDVFIPASGETDAQLGNTLPTQGFVEVTIKDLESVLHQEVSRLWSKKIISVFADAKAQFDHETNSLIKLGKHLKANDLILRRKDANGNSSDEQHTWKVVDLVYAQPLNPSKLRIGEEYGLFIREQKAILPFRLTNVDLHKRQYTFRALQEGVPDCQANVRNLPSVYSKGTTIHAGVHAILLESLKRGSSGTPCQEELTMHVAAEQKFTLDCGHCHIVECIG